MNFYVNGNKLDITLENEKTVGDVLKGFEEEAEKNDATTVSIELNGNVIDAEKLDEAFSQELSESTDLRLQVISKNDITQNFAINAENFMKISEGLQNISVLLQSGKEKDANEIIENLANEIDRFCHTATLSALFPDTYRKIIIDGNDLGTFFGKFTPIFKDFKDAMEAKDTVTVADLAEYEISPRLEQIAKAIADSQ